MSNIFRRLKRKSVFRRPAILNRTDIAIAVIKELIKYYPKNCFKEIDIFFMETVNELVFVVHNSQYFMEWFEEYAYKNLKLLYVHYQIMICKRKIRYLAKRAVEIQ